MLFTVTRKKLSSAITAFYTQTKKRQPSNNVLASKILAKIIAKRGTFANAFLH